MFQRIICASCDGIDLDPTDDGPPMVDQDGDGTPDPLGEPDETISGDLADGAAMNLGWADDSPLFCWVATENMNFDGNHVLFEGIEKQGSGNVVIAVDPDSGVDVSIYTLEFLPANVQTPPDVTSATRCEAGFDQQNDSNPGDTEYIGPLIGYSDRVITLGVAGADGATSGAFTVSIWRLEGGLIDGDTGT